MTEPVIPSPRQPLDGRARSMMVALCVCWGLQQVAIKAAAPQMNPVLQVGIRSLIAALLVAGLMLVREGSLRLRDGTLGAGLLVGFLFGNVFVCVSTGLNYTSAPFIGVVFGVVLLKEPLDPRFVLGAVMVLAGITIVSRG